MAERTRYSFHDVRRTLEKHSARLLAHPNVLYVGIGEKERKRAGEGRLAIRVYVSRKKGDVSHPVPKRLRAVRRDGTLADFYIPTDVQRRPRELKALGLRGGDGIAGPMRGVAGMVFPVRGQNYILTNAHVAVGLNQLADGQFVTSVSGQVVGRAVRATPVLTGGLNTMDAAAVLPVVQTDAYVIDGGLRVAAIGDLAPGMTGQFFFVRRNGGRTGCVKPNWVATPRAVTFPGQAARFVNFFELEVNGGNVPVAGDSGSVILSDRGDGMVVHGLLFAGGGKPGERKVVGALGARGVFAALSAARAAGNVKPMNMRPARESLANRELANPAQSLAAVEA